MIEQVNINKSRNNNIISNIDIIYLKKIGVS